MHPCNETQNPRNVFWPTRGTKRPYSAKKLQKNTKWKMQNRSQMENGHNENILNNPTACCIKTWGKIENKQEIIIYTKWLQRGTQAPREAKNSSNAKMIDEKWWNRGGMLRTNRMINIKVPFVNHVSHENTARTKRQIFSFCVCIWMKLLLLFSAELQLDGEFFFLL